MRTNNDCRQAVRTTMRHYNDCRKPGDNVHIYGNDEKVINIYNSN